MELYWFPPGNNLSIHRPHSSLSRQKAAQLMSLSYKQGREMPCKTLLQQRYNIIQGQIHNCESLQAMGDRRGIHHIGFQILQLMGNHIPVFPHDRDRGQCLSFQVELVSQEAQNQDEPLINEQGSGRWKMITHSFSQHQMKEIKHLKNCCWLQYTKKCLIIPKVY